MTAGRMLSLAAGVVLDLDPPAAVETAAETGWDAVGLWFDPATWTSATTAAVADRLQATGIVALDMEPVILGRGADPGDELIDAAAELGVRHVLVGSGPAERAAVVSRMAELCERAYPHHITIVLEFLPIFTIGSLTAARSVVEEVGHPSGAVLVDTLHLARSGGSPRELIELPAGLVPYLQIADASAEPADGSPTGLREEALHGRLLPGDGDLPLAEVLAIVPDVPLSVELRSRALMERHVDARERSQVVLEATRRLLARPVLS